MMAESTPPADDVREALAREIADGGEPFDEDFRAADDVLRRFEVRPRGTVTPSADDVRETLVRVILNACASPDAVYDPEAREIADALLAAFEVRPR